MASGTTKQTRPSLKYSESRWASMEMNEDAPSAQNMVTNMLHASVLTYSGIRCCAGAFLSPPCACVSAISAAPRRGQEGASTAPDAGICEHAGVQHVVTMFCALGASS